MKLDLLSLTHLELKEQIKGKGIAGYIADQLYHWLYRAYQIDPEKWTNISKANRDLLFESFSLHLPQVIWQGLSKDGTRKFLLKMQDGQTVEAVALPGRNRLSICLSSQVGCAVGCRFCHTGTQGLKRHLSTAEVVGQYVAVTHWLQTQVNSELKFSNIVYMGQGEPLHNFENVKKATEIFVEPKGIGLGQRRITLSTSGLVPQIKRLHEFPPINFAISLHSAHNDARTALMPINKVYNLEKLFQAIQTIPLKAHRRITYEYLLIDDFNDRPEDIIALAKLLKRSESKINIIPFNEYPGAIYKRPSDEKIAWFCHQLNDRGFTCTVRTTKGEDILAACGQLKSEYDKVNLWQEDQQLKVLSEKKKSQFSFT